MDETMMRTISKDLDALVNEFGTDENGNKKVTIPASRDEAMRFMKKWAYESKGNFSFDDPEIVEEARRLVQKHGEVWVVDNKQTMQWELYIPPDTATTPTKKSGGCFIATAVYGSYDSPEVKLPRRFRDDVLARSFLGKQIVELYYRICPHFVSSVRKQFFLRKLLEVVVFTPLVWTLKNRNSKSRQSVGS